MKNRIAPSTQLALPPLARWALCSALAAACLPATAQLAPGDLVSVLTLAQSTALKQTPPSARLEVQAGTLDPRLKLAPCARTEAYLSAGAPVWGRTRVGLRCKEGAVAWNVSVPVVVKVLAPALTVRDALPAGYALTAADLVPAESDWAASPGSLFTDASALVGRRLGRALSAGQALNANDLRARQWFASGDTVRVVAVGEGFAIAAEGQALSNGIEGQVVKVRTEQGRVLTGLPTGERRVEVAL